MQRFVAPWHCVSAVAAAACGHLALVLEVFLLSALDLVNVVLELGHGVLTQRVELGVKPLDLRER
jgi:hypothetical protein